MAQAVSKFFGILGEDVTAPTNMQELIPYLLTVFVSIVLVVCAFRLIAAVASAIVNWRKF